MSDPTQLASEFGIAKDDSAALAELRQLSSLHHALAEMRLSVPEAFCDSVMRRIEAERSAVSRPVHATSSWLAAAGVLVALLGLIVWLAAGRVHDGGTVSTLADMAVATLTAGAGLLGASWKGIGTIATSWLHTSPTTFFAAAAAVLGAQVLLLRRLRKRRRATADAARNR